MPKKLSKWVWILGVIAVLIVGVKVAWGINYPSGTWRYKLTVEVDTPEGVKTGSAVREVKAHTSPKLVAGIPNFSMSVKGEAVVVDLGSYGQVFALLKTYQHGVDGAHYIVSDAFPLKQANIYDQVRYYKSLNDTAAVLTARQYPMFVRFRDPADPKTVENLLEYEPCADERGIPRNTICLKNDRFAEAFGEGVSLKSVTIEMTREPVTTGVVENYLPPPDGKPHLFTRNDFIRE